MKLYFNSSELPNLNDLDTVLSDLQTQVVQLKKLKVDLSLEERLRSRKMAARRLAYARLANRKGKQYESIMPRIFIADDFDAIMKHHEKLEAIFDTVKEIGFEKTDKYEDANCYLLNTCHIRDKAKDKVYRQRRKV